MAPDRRDGRTYGFPTYSYERIDMENTISLRLRRGIIMGSVPQPYGL